MVHIIFSMFSAKDKTTFLLQQLSDSRYNQKKDSLGFTTHLGQV